MPNKMTTVNFSIEAELKEQADELFAYLGLDLNTAFNIFIHKVLDVSGIPFAVALDKPNKETIAAMLEAERIARAPDVKGYTNMDELFSDLEK